MSTLAELAHRPYPPPTSPFAMHMRWVELLFAHWRVPAQALRDQLPAGLELDLFEGEAWIGVVPFRMENTRPRFCPPIPGLSAFPELNVRTYVRRDGRPGVWFFSLDAAQRIAVRAARWSFYLPYFDARMSVRREASRISYESERVHKGAPAGVFRGRYGPVGPERIAAPGSLERWLTERYCLYSANARGEVYRGEIHHGPWPLRDAEAELELCTVTSSAGLSLPDEAPLLHYVERIDVVGWLLSKA